MNSKVNLPVFRVEILLPVRSGTIQLVDDNRISNVEWIGCEFSVRAVFVVEHGNISTKY